jgi:hypothetical protein
MGMDETVINGAMAFFKEPFGIASNDLLTTTKLGAICAAPYICCALLACCETAPLPPGKNISFADDRLQG